MYVRRKSNWYIYFIAFGITAVFVVVAIFAFKWYLFPSDTQNTGVNKTNNALEDEFTPTTEHCFRLLTMLSEGENDIPELFFLTEYNAPENRITFVPLPNGISVGGAGRPLQTIYVAQGGAEVVKAVEGAIGISVGYYVKMDKQSFEDLFTTFGNVEYEFTKTTLVKYGTDTKTFNAGKRLMAPEDAYNLMVKAEFDEGDAYRFKVAGEILSEIINQNYRQANATRLDSYFNMLLKSETNLTEDVYKSYKPALLNTVEYGTSPAEFYIPYGEYTADGGFDIAENSINTIKYKAGL
ncbi:MAG: LCP family protein [Oscillospiraceae bacterium]|nr:LCP family protein [Oscillospiraceae bacterium]